MPNQGTRCSCTTTSSKTWTANLKDTQVPEKDQQRYSPFSLTANVGICPINRAPDGGRPPPLGVHIAKKKNFNYLLQFYKILWKSSFIFLSTDNNGGINTKWTIGDLRCIHPTNTTKCIIRCSGKMYSAVCGEITRQLVISYCGWHHGIYRTLQEADCRRMYFCCS